MCLAPRFSRILYWRPAADGNEFKSLDTLKSPDNNPAALNPGLAAADRLCPHTRYRERRSRSEEICFVCRYGSRTKKQKPRLP
jgi:hypothetical protein